MRIIGLHGKARSGKDEFSDILCKTYGFRHIAFAEGVKQFGIKYFDLPEEQCYGTKTKNSRLILQGIGNSVRNNISTIANLTTEERSVVGVSGFPTWVEDMACEEFGIEPVGIKRKLKYNKQVLNGIADMWAGELETFVKISDGNDKNFWVHLVFDAIDMMGNDDTVYVITDVRYKNEKQIIEEQGGKMVKIVRMDKPPIEAGAEHPSEVDLDRVAQWDCVVLNEHKTDWRERLMLAGSNLVRMLLSEKYFTDRDIEQFKIKL